MEKLSSIPTPELSQMLRELCQFKHKMYPGRRVGRLEKEVHRIKNELRKRKDKKTYGLF
jgi:hypothetical protein